MNTLRFVGGDPLSPESWEKSMKPLLQNGPHGNGPWGPGHGSFIHLGSNTVCIYHATDGPGDGWGNRKARVQRLEWTANGPSMGDGVGPLGGTEAFVGGNAGHGHDSHEHEHKHHGFKRFFQKLRDEL